MKVVTQYHLGIEAAIPLNEFADAHDFFLVLEERSPENREYIRRRGRDYRWMASMCWHRDRRTIEEATRGMLASIYGNGATREAAVEDLCRNLQGRRLAFGSRRDLIAPMRLIPPTVLS